MKTRYLTQLKLCVLSTLVLALPWQNTSAAGLNGENLQLKENPFSGVDLPEVDEDESSAKEYAGGPTFAKCTKDFATKDWKTMLSNHGNGAFAWNAQFKEIFDDFKEAIVTEIGEDDILKETSSSASLKFSVVDSKYCPTPDASTGCGENGHSKEDVEKALKELATIATDNIKKIQSTANKVAKCEAYRSLSNYDVDYSDTEQTTANSSNKTSADGQIKCQTVGAETQDFNSCVSAVNAYDAALVGTVGLQTFQEVDFVDTTLEIQDNFDGNNPTSGLEAQRDAIQKRADQATERAAFDAAKVGLLLTMWQKMPELSDVIDKCNSDGGIKADHINVPAGKVIKAINTVMGNLIQSGGSFQIKLVSADDFDELDVSDGGGAAASGSLTVHSLENEQIIANIDDYCDKVASENSGSIVMNGKARDAIKQAMINSGIELTKDALTAKLLNDQAGRIDDAIDEASLIDLGCAGGSVSGGTM